MKNKTQKQLSFKKETISVLNDNTMKTINGGGFLSILGTSCVKRKCIARGSNGPTACPDYEM